MDDLRIAKSRTQCTSGWHEHGQDLVETALVFPLLLLLTIGIIEFGIIILSYNTVANAARDGARFAAVQPVESLPLPNSSVPGTCSATGSNHVIEEACNRTAGLIQDSVAVTVTMHSGGRVQVEVAYEVPIVAATFLGLNPKFPVSSSASMQHE
jgi:Flp pilus assembly protein TadG